LSDFIERDKFIDPADIFVEYIKEDLNKILNEENMLGSEEFYVSANPDAFIKNSKLFYDVIELPTVV
jgi:hypothetical protein